MLRTPREIVDRIHAIRRGGRKLSPFEIFKNRNFYMFLVYLLVFAGLIVGVLVVAPITPQAKALITMLIFSLGLPIGFWLFFLFALKAWFEPVTRRTNLVAALERCLEILEAGNAEEEIIEELEEFTLDCNRTKPGGLTRVLPFGRAEKWRIKKAWVDAYSWVASPEDLKGNNWKEAK